MTQSSGCLQNSWLSVCPHCHIIYVFLSMCVSMCVCVKQSLCVHHRRLCLSPLREVSGSWDRGAHTLLLFPEGFQNSRTPVKGEQIYLYNIYRSSNYISQQTGKYFRKSISKKRQIRGGDAGIKGGISLEVLFQSFTDSVSTVVDIQEDPTVTKPSLSEKEKSCLLSSNSSQRLETTHLYDIPFDPSSCSSHLHRESLRVVLSGLNGSDTVILWYSVSSVSSHCRGSCNCDWKLWWKRRDKGGNDKLLEPLSPSLRGLWGDAIERHRSPSSGCELLLSHGKSVRNYCPPRPYDTTHPSYLAAIHVLPFLTKRHQSASMNRGKSPATGKKSESSHAEQLEHLPGKCLSSHLMYDVKILGMKWGEDLFSLLTFHFNFCLPFMESVTEAPLERSSRVSLVPLIYRFLFSHHLHHFSFSISSTIICNNKANAVNCNTF